MYSVLSVQFGRTISCLANLLHAKRGSMRLKYYVYLLQSLSLCVLACTYCTVAHAVPRRRKIYNITLTILLLCTNIDNEKKKNVCGAVEM